MEALIFYGLKYFFNIFHLMRNVNGHQQREPNKDCKIFTTTLERMFSDDVDNEMEKQLNSFTPDVCSDVSLHSFVCFCLFFCLWHPD